MFLRGWGKILPCNECARAHSATGHRSVICIVDSRWQGLAKRSLVSRLAMEGIEELAVECALLHYLNTSINEIEAEGPP